MHGCVDGGGEEEGGGERFGKLAKSGLFCRVSSEADVLLKAKCSLNSRSDHGV